MDHAEFNAVLADHVDRMKTTLKAKSKEYATPTDKLANFKKAAVLKDETPSQALWGMGVKHIVSISDMVMSGQQYPEAVWHEKIGDASNYLVLLQAALVEEDNENQRYSLD